MKRLAIGWIAILLVSAMLLLVGELTARAQVSDQEPVDIVLPGSAIFIDPHLAAIMTSSNAFCHIPQNGITGLSSNYSKSKNEIKASWFENISQLEACDIR